MQDKWKQLCTDADALYAHIKNRLGKHKPQTYKFEDAPARPAAVIIPLFFKNGEAHMDFTQRTEKVNKHKGQVSFPGGTQDDTDADSLQAALRETHEEMGILPQDITVLGRTDNFLTNTHFLVTPWVGHFPYPYEYVISRDEIEKVIEVPLIHLLDDGSFEIRDWERNGKWYKIHFYEYNGDVIWGVTGFLLSNFLHIVFDVPRMTANPA